MQPDLSTLNQRLAEALGVPKGFPAERVVLTIQGGRPPVIEVTVNARRKLDEADLQRLEALGAELPAPCFGAACAAAPVAGLDEVRLDADAQQRIQVALCDLMLRHPDLKPDELARQLVGAFKLVALLSRPSAPPAAS